MQSKKRAKPVKFGSASKEKKEKVEAQDKAEEKKVDREVEEKVEELKAKEEMEEKEAGKGSDAHQASKVEDIEDKDEIPADKEEDERKEDLDEDFGSDEEGFTDEDIIVSESDDEDDLSDEEIFAHPPGESDSKKGAFRYFMKVVITTFILALILFAGGYYAYTNQDKILSRLNSPSPTPSAPPAATPTPEPVDLAEFSIIVLNGTDISGLASDTQESLEEAGFNVISVGNADDNLDETEIQASEAVSKEFLEKLREELSKTFTIGETTTLSTGEADIIINLGSPSAEEN